MTPVAPDFGPDADGARVLPEKSRSKRVIRPLKSGRDERPTGVRAPGRTRTCDPRLRRPAVSVG